ncbi:MAG: hypothetical protein D6797_01745 [Bdellovibrio sp.]|nr:MAG: hypothetical protein D6797_01745 [Bdellovibrio sp.]
MMSSNPIGKFSMTTLVVGVLLVILGTVGFFLPYLMSLSTALFFAWLLIVGGVMWGIHVLKYNVRSFLDWLKPVLLVVIGGMMLYSPLSSVAAIGLLLSVYLLLDAFGSFALANAFYPTKGWGWMIFNGIASLILALLFLIGWPTTSLWLVGLYVSISLFFDGVSLIALGLTFRSLSRSS